MAQTLIEKQLTGMSKALPRVIVDGDKERARTYIGPALSQMRILDNAMSFQKLKQGVRRVWLSPDVYVECSRVFYNKVCKIWARPVITTVPNIVIPSASFIIAYGYYNKAEGYNWQLDLLKEEAIDVSYQLEWPPTYGIQGELSENRFEKSFTYDSVTVIIASRLLRNNLVYSAQVLYNGVLLERADYSLIKTLIDFAQRRTDYLGCDILPHTETDDDGQEETFYRIALFGLVPKTSVTDYSSKQRIYEFRTRKDGNDIKLVNIVDAIVVPEHEDRTYTFLGCRLKDELIGESLLIEVVYRCQWESEDTKYDALSIYSPISQTWNTTIIAQLDTITPSAFLVSQESWDTTWPEERDSVYIGNIVKLILWNPIKRDAVYILEEHTTNSFDQEVTTDNPYYINFANGTNRGFDPFVSSMLGHSLVGEPAPSYVWPPTYLLPYVESDVVIAMAKTEIVLNDYILGDSLLDGGSILYQDTEYGICEINMPSSRPAATVNGLRWDARVLWYDKGEREVTINDNAKTYSFDRAVFNISNNGLCAQVTETQYVVDSPGDNYWSTVKEKDYPRPPYEFIRGEEQEPYLLGSLGEEKVSLSPSFPYNDYVKAVLLHSIDDVFPRAVVYARQEYADDEETIQSDGVRGMEFYMITENGNKVDIGKNIETLDGVFESKKVSQWERVFFTHINTSQTLAQK